mgnify:CR=1 FL=1|tara:strand:+ start:952 stop:2172 length:1221 start_codon:yes stop_codon:yes gene_type:complete
MVLENYDTGVTRKSFDEITEQDRQEARLNVDPTGTRFDAATGQWTETFMPEYIDRVYGEGGGYYAPQRTPESFGADDFWTDSAGTFGDTGMANPFGVPVGKKPKKPKKPSESDDYKEYLAYLKSQGIAGAKSVMTGFLNQFGLGALTDWAMGMAEQGLSGDAIVTEMRYGSDPNVRSVYDAKFPAMKARRDAGYTAITEGEYMQLGRGYSQIAAAAGISPDFLGGDGINMKEDGVTALIGGDVSLAEWRSRVSTAEEAANEASPEVKALLESRYNFNSGDLVSAFLDPTRTKNIVDAKRQFGAATLAGTAQQVVGSAISQAGSEWMFNQDIQAREVAQAFAPIRGLTESTLTSEGMSADDLAAGRFGGGLGRKNFQRNLQSRVSEFDKDAGIAMGQQGIYGLGSAE